MPTQFINTMNKTEAGFHLLMILSKADGIIEKSESDVLFDFLENNFNEPIDYNKRTSIFNGISSSEDLMESFH
jgi:hypothetical protein